MNKSVPQSPKSVGSISSETSETQSVSDELQSTTNNAGKNAKMAAAIAAAAKGVKKPKEVERPPWRPGNSNSALALAAKNSLKAKLLDASRRIARQNRQNNMYTQTDIIPTKLMKEFSTDTNNLIKTRDQGILTDDTPILTIRDNLRGTLILTHTVSQQTDFIEYDEKETQTPMPRSNISFTKYIKNLNDKSKNDNYNNSDSINILNNNENTLLKQINDIIDIDKKLIEQNNHFFNDSMENLNQDNINNNTIDDNDNENTLDMQQAPDLISAVDGNISLQQPFLASPTYSSWQDIEDFSDNDNDLPELPRRTVSEGVKPWSEFKDLVLSKRLTNMKLSPIPPRRPSKKKKNVTWSDREHFIIKEFLNEANELLNIFGKVTMLLGPDININNSLPNICDIEIPEFKWDSILTNSCNLLDEKLQKIQPIHINENVENLNPELLNYLHVNFNEENLQID